MKNFTACIIGSCGSVGSAAALELQKRGFHLRLAARRESPKDKPDDITGPGDDIVCFDVNDFDAARRFCRGADVVVGAAGPSAMLSEAMFSAACAEKVPYVDPGGGLMMYQSNLRNQTTIPGVLHAGVFPGLSGILLRLILEESQDLCRKLEVAVGGRYSFTRAAAADFEAESHLAGAGVPMACIREGNVVPAQNAEMRELPLTFRNLKSFPYLSEEVQRIARHYKLCCVDSYTLVEEKVFHAIAGGLIKKDALMQVSSISRIPEAYSVIIVRLEKNGSLINRFFIGDEPGKVSGIVSALAALQVVTGNVSPGFHYCSDIFVPEQFLKILHESMIFKYEKSEQSVRYGLETGTL